MKLGIEQILLLSKAEVPTLDEAEALLVQLDDDALESLRDLAAMVALACACENEARSEGVSKRKDC